MGRFLHLNLSELRSWKKSVIYILWFLGLATGALASQLIYPIDISTYLASLTFGELFCVRIIPLFATVLTILLSNLWLLVPVIFFKAFFFSFVVICMAKTAGDSAWLITITSVFSIYIVLSESICKVFAFHENVIFFL